jgi:hypothetical protein
MPLSRFQLSSNVTTPLTGLGFCAHPPIGGTFGAFQYFQVSLHDQQGLHPAHMHTCTQTAWMHPPE